MNKFVMAKALYLASCRFGLKSSLSQKAQWMTLSLTYLTRIKWEAGFLQSIGEKADYKCNN